MLKEKAKSTKHKLKPRASADLKPKELTDYVSIKIQFKSAKEEEKKERERQAALQAKQEAYARLKAL